MWTLVPWPGIEPGPLSWKVLDYQGSPRSANLDASGHPLCPPLYRADGLSHSSPYLFEWPIMAFALLRTYDSKKICLWALKEFTHKNAWSPQSVLQKPSLSQSRKDPTGVLGRWRHSGIWEMPVVCLRAPSCFPHPTKIPDIRCVGSEVKF